MVFMPPFTVIFMPGARISHSQAFCLALTFRSQLHLGSRTQGRCFVRRQCLPLLTTVQGGKKSWMRGAYARERKDVQHSCSQTLFSDRQGSSGLVKHFAMKTNPAIQYLTP